MAELLAATDRPRELRFLIPQRLLPWWPANERAAFGRGGFRMASHSTPIAERLTRLSPSSQVAFAAACAERTLPVYEADDYPGAETGIVALRQAINFMWRTLSAGECSAEEGRAVRAAVEAALPSREESCDGGVYLPTLLAATTVQEALEAALGTASASPARAAQTSLDAFNAFFEVVGAERASRHEERWQEAAVNALEQDGTQPPSRERFRDLGVPETELVVEEEDYLEDTKDALP
jgi:uncharacterized protein YjaG (DUF416 family)